MRVRDRERSSPRAVHPGRQSDSVERRSADCTAPQVGRHEDATAAFSVRARVPRHGRENGWTRYGLDDAGGVDIKETPKEAAARGVSRRSSSAWVCGTSTGSWSGQVEPPAAGATDVTIAAVQSVYVKEPGGVRFESRPGARFASTRSGAPASRRPAPVRAVTRAMSARCRSDRPSLDHARAGAPERK